MTVCNPRGERAEGVIQATLDDIARQQREEERQVQAKRMYMPLTRNQIMAIFWPQFSEIDRRRATTVGDNIDVLYKIYLDDFELHCADLPDRFRQKVA